MKVEDKIKNENMDSPKHLPGFVVIPIKERLSIQHGCLWGKGIEDCELVYKNRKERNCVAVMIWLEVFDKKSQLKFWLD